MTNLQVYVGTYRKYNEGSLYGKWINLSDYSDLEAFYKDIRELHKDEKDPEYMFQDYEVPKLIKSLDLISEGYISKDIFEILRNIGVQEDKLGNTSKAIEYITLANEISKKNLNSYGEVMSFTALGEVYETKDLQKALSAYREAEGLALENDIPWRLGPIYEGVYKVYKAR